jgi:hypothetical protein
LPALGCNALVGEGVEDVVAAVGAVYAGDALTPIAATPECRSFAAYTGEAELGEGGGIALFVDGLESV